MAKIFTVGRLKIVLSLDNKFSRNWVSIQVGYETKKYREWKKLIWRENSRRQQNKDTTSSLKL